MSWVSELVDVLGTAGEIITPFITTADEQREYDLAMNKYKAKISQAKTETAQMQITSEMVQTVVLGVGGLSLVALIIWKFFG